jgi:signal peptidase I
MGKKIKTVTIRVWLWVRPILVVVIALTCIRSAVADWNDVPTGSMNPSILEGDRILVNKLAYDLKVPYTTWRLARWSAPQRGDIVVFNSPADGTRLVKRVIGLPGDVLELRNDRLFLNGRPAEYQFDDAPAAAKIVGRESADGLSHPMQILPATRAMRSFGPLTVPQGQYFMMGDNRDVSFDSRYFGTVPMDHILGKAPAVVLSVDPAHYYMPRFDRFFKALP